MAPDTVEEIERAISVLTPQQLEELYLTFGSTGTIRWTLASTRT